MSARGGRHGGVVGGSGGGGTLRHVMKESILHKRSVFLVGPKSSLRPFKCTVYTIIAKAESHFYFISPWAPWLLAPGAESQGGGGVEINHLQNEAPVQAHITPSADCDGFCVTRCATFLQKIQHGVLSCCNIARYRRPLVIMLPRGVGKQH